MFGHLFDLGCYLEILESGIAFWYCSGHISIDVVANVLVQKQHVK